MGRQCGSAEFHKSQASISNGRSLQFPHLNSLIGKGLSAERTYCVLKWIPSSAVSSVVVTV